MKVRAGDMIALPTILSTLRGDGDMRVFEALSSRDEMTIRLAGVGRRMVRQQNRLFMVW